jgi:hypothetical protein
MSAYALIVGAISLVAVIGIRLCCTRRSREYKQQWRRLEKVAATGMLFNFAGEVGLYQLYRVGFPYDKVLHFGFPLLVAVALTDFFRTFKMLPKKAIITAVGAVIAGGIVWELFEFLMDYFFNTKLFGIDGSFLVKDTAWDLICDSIGSLCGGIAAFLSYNPYQRYHYRRNNEQANQHAL